MSMTLILLGTFAIAIVAAVLLGIVAYAAACVLVAAIAAGPKEVGIQSLLA